MKLLMITRKVDKDDHLAGFTYTWVKKLAGQVDQLKVICLQSGVLDGLPDNVEIFGLNKVGRIAKFLKFNKLAFKLIREVDGIFCHMNPEYTIAIAPYAKLFGKKIVSWYTHGSINFKMRLMAKIADVILTASKDSFRLLSKKVVVVGHGIDLDRFQPGVGAKLNDFLELLTVGRISPTKDYESMIKAVDILTKQGIDRIKLYIIGDIGLKEHQSYLDDLKQMVEKMNLKNKVQFFGPVPNSDIASHLQQADVFINLSGTGSLDKAVLEAMACGCLVLTSNTAFINILPAKLIVEKDSPQILAERIKWIQDLSSDKVSQLSEQLHQEVFQNHNLDNLVKKIIKQF